MGLFDRIFGNNTTNAQRVDASSTFKALTAYQPVFNNWGGAVYESELVRSAIDAKARHIGKLSIDIMGSAKPKTSTRLMKRPNEMQTWYQFLYRVSTILDVHNTAFIVPSYDKFGSIQGIYPVLPTMAVVVDVDGEPYLKYRFGAGDTAAVRMSACGVITKFQHKNDFFGESNRALNPTMGVVNVQNQGIEEAVKTSASFRFMARLTNFSTPKDIKKEQERFAENQLTAEGGMLLFPNTYADIKQIDSKPYIVDAEQMEYIRTNVFNYFGVNESVLQNKANGDELDAFFNGAIEPFSIQLSEVLTNMLFTDREQAQGNKVLATSNRLQYMSTDKKISMAQNLGDRGYITVNEIRALFNLEELPEEEGNKRPVRGEYYFLDENGAITKKEDNADATETE